MGTKTLCRRIKFANLPIIQEIIRRGICSGKVEEAHIVAIREGENKEVPLNYRPVSLLSTLIKVLEGIIKDRWLKCFEYEEIILCKPF